MAPSFTFSAEVAPNEATYSTSAGILAPSDPTNDVVVTRAAPMRFRAMATMSPKRIVRCSLLVVAVCSLISASCSPSTSPGLSYSLHVSSAPTHQMTINLLLTGRSGPYLDLRGHSPSDVMLVKNLDATGGNGERLRWIERPETVRVGGSPIKISTYRILGPIPSRLSVRYQVSPGRREGDAHIGFTGRCFGYLGPEFAIVTGRDVFLVPERPESFRRIEVGFALPSGWKPETPWRRSSARWVVEASRGSAAEHLVASTIGLGCFRERSFLAGRTRVRLVFVEPSSPDAHAEQAEEGIRRAVEYLRDVFGRDLGPSYLAVVAPETPEGYDIVGGGWASGQGCTLLPLSTERLREFTQEFIQAYVRYPPYRTEIRRPEEFWLVDAIANLYSRRAVARAGLGDDEGVARGLAAGYLSAVTTQGVSRDLERTYTAREAGAGENVTRESIAPFILLLLDHELRKKHAVARGLDSIISRSFEAALAPSIWSLLPDSRSREWESFRTDYVRGATVAPVPDLFMLTPTRDSPSPRGGEPASHVTIVYTGNTDAYLENCGCKVNESGGIARRATVLDSIRMVDPEAVVLDAGNAFDRPDQYQSTDVLAKEEQRFYLEMMDRMRFSAAAIGMGEVARGPRYFREETRGLTTPFLATNVSAGTQPLGPPSVYLRSHGHRIAVIGVFEPPRGGRSQLQVDRELIRLRTDDPIEAVRKEVATIHSRADLLFVIGKLSPTSIRRLVEVCPELSVIVSTDYSAPQWGPGSTATDQVIEQNDRPGFIGRTLVLYTQIGQYGLSIARLDLDRTGRTVGAKLTDRWLTAAVPDQDGIRRALNRFYHRVGAMPSAQASVRPPLAQDPYWQGKRYVGAETCRRCHALEFEQWKTTPHASAYKTLLDRHRHYQPVCVACHVVGYGSPSGYRIGQSEDPFGNVQCEICHGPGADHVTTTSKSSIRREVPEHVCKACHNPEHSDRFVYAERLPMVVHRSLDHLSER
jgi:hypothetical protein